MNEEQVPYNVEERLNAKIKEGYSYNFDVFFKEGWVIFKQIFWMVTLSIVILSIPVIIINFVLAPLLTGPEVRPQFKPGDTPSFSDMMELIRETQRQVSFSQRLIQVALNFVMILIFAPLQAGFINISREADKDGAAFNEVFTHYKSPLTGKIVVAGLITTGISSVLSLGLSYMPIAGSFINILLSILFYYLFIYVVPFILFGNVGVSKAFSLSIKLFFHKPWPVIGFTILYGLLSLTGMVACCIGVIFTIAFMPVCNYLLYKHSVGFPEDELENTQDEGHWQDQPPTV